jgi:prevent-host-death family protein
MPFQGEVLSLIPTQGVALGYIVWALQAKSGCSFTPDGSTEKPMKKAALSDVKDDLSKYLRLGEKEGIVITRHGKPAGVLIGFADKDDWFDYSLENDPRFLKRIASAREKLRAGQGVLLEDIE